MSVGDPADQRIKNKRQCLQVFRVTTSTTLCVKCTEEQELTHKAAGMLRERLSNVSYLTGL